MDVDPATEVTNITVDRDDHVEIVFGDGRTCRFDLLELRVNCPCATCRTLRDQQRVPWPPPGVDAGGLSVVDAELVGAWGLGITWNDGHATGIFPFESLRRWCEAGDAGTAFPADSGLGEPER